VDWRGILVENWPYKLAALVLAILLWFNVAAERRQEHPVPTRLEVQVRDPNWVITEAPDRVRTTFQGRGGDIFSLPMNPPVIRRVIDSVTGPTMALDLSPSMVSYDRDLKIDPVAVHPSQVEIHLERRVSRKVPVAPRLVLSAASGFAIVRPVRLKPDSVTLQGPRSALATIDSLLTEKVTMQDLGQSVTRELQLEPPAGVPGLKVEPANVLVTVEVDSLVEASLTVPLRATGAAAGSGRLGQDSVAVVVRGPREAIRGLDPAQIRAFVVVDSVAAGGVSLPVQIRLPEGLQATGTPSPASVTVTPRKAGS
jgi:YbbR domain-containing protein